MRGWLPLHEHLADTAEIAAMLWDRWLGEQRRQVVASRVGDADVARSLATFLAGVHDVGKASPPFVSKVPALAETLRSHGLEFPFVPTSEDRRMLPHGLAGQVIVEDFLEQRGWAPGASAELGSVVGGHHGLPPSTSAVQAARSRAHLLGDVPWRQVQQELLEDALERSGLDLDRLRGRPLGTPALVILAGLVIVADWLASNEDLFPFANPGRQLVSREGRVEAAWRKIDLPGAWRAQDSDVDADALLAQRFLRESGARAVQKAAVESARICDVPGIVVIEAPMGEGKTEAALLAAEVLAARSGATGVAYALPTQATANAMFARILQWLGQVPDAAVASEARARHATVLAHGKATLDATFRQLRTRSRSQGVGIDEAVESLDVARSQSGAAIDAYVHSWMTSRKKTPLADFLVCTVDQVLFLALQARHLALRHLGLAGKVVIVDEVHAYDAYMSVYLTRALSWLGAYGCPVVLLSATLPSQVRRRLVAAYDEGRAAVAPQESDEEELFPDWRSAGPAPTPPVTHQVEEHVVYPAVTSVVGGEVVRTAVGASAKTMTVDLELRRDASDSLDEVLGEILPRNGCVLVVRNTVARAQATYQALVDRWGEETVTLAHSRFLAHDRAELDSRLVALFGPPPRHPAQEADRRRPERHVVVATQVLEQSLDVDFDLLVTDLAPIDVLLQRVGRLHRHERPRPALLEAPRCVVVGVPDTDGEPVTDPGSDSVYGRFALLQAASLLRSRTQEGGRLSVPGDVAPWVEAAYGPRDLGPETWRRAQQDARAEAEARRISKESAAGAFRIRPPSIELESLSAWLRGGAGDADESARGSAQVRDSEDSVEVLLLSRDRDGVLRLPRWVGEGELAGAPVPLHFEPDTALASAIASCSIRLPAGESRGARGDAIVEELSRNWYLEAWQRVPELRGHLLLVLDEQADGSLVGTVARRRFVYTRRDGLKVDRLPAEV